MDMTAVGRGEFEAPLQREVLRGVVLERGWEKMGRGERTLRMKSFR